jgi:3-oxoacyl-[acyl-carrier protein] reductase
MKVQNKVILITGAGSGIGRETAIMFAKNGARVVVTDVDEKGGKETVDEIVKVLAENPDNPGDAFFIKLDTSNREQTKQVAKEVIERYGKIDVLVNNAGIIQDALVTKMTEDQWNKVIDVDLKGPFNMVQSVVENMIEHKIGEIINVSSVVGVYGNVGQANYAAAKAGLIGLTKTLAKELGKKGIRVNAVAPGFIQTHMTEGLPDKILDAMKDKTPLKRLGLPSDVAYAIMFLASDGANFINGIVLPVDGGLVI